MIFAAFFSSPEAERQKGEKDEFCYAERTKKDGSYCRRRKTASFFEKILEEGTEVVLRKLMENHAEVVVYKNGYVSYQAHERSTVFPIHDCKHYHYESQGNEQQTIPHDHFEDMEWHIRLVIEGEDRLAHNTSSRESEGFSSSEDIKTLERSVVVELLDHIDVHSKTEIEIHFCFEDELHSITEKFTEYQTHHGNEVAEE